jgi:hypothetical protein
MGLLGFGLALAILLDAASSVRAATATCIEASRYATLARITSGSLDRLARGLIGGAPGRLPPAAACRAVLLSGPIVPGSADALIDAIAKSRGWLAWVYLAASDGDLAEEVKLAEIMRDFRLSTMVMQTDLDYVADFLSDPPSLPASVSYAWPEAQREVKSPLAERLDDYLQNTQRRIARGADMCGRGCWTIAAGSVDRRAAGLTVLMQNARSPAPAATEDADTAKIRAEVRRGFGLDIVPRQRPFGWVADRAVPRLPSPILDEVRQVCHPRIDYAAALQAEIGRDVDGFAGHNFSYMDLGKLAPKFRSFQEASDGVDLCLTQVLDRARTKAFADRCGAGCSRAALSQAFDAGVRRILDQPDAAHVGPRQP